MSIDDFISGASRATSCAVKRIALLICLVLPLFFPTVASAHNRFEIDAMIGGRVGGSGQALYKDSSMNVTEGRVLLDPALSYGGMFGYRAQRDGFIYLSFSRQVAPVHLDGDTQDDLVTGKLAVEYYQFGGTLELTRGRWVPYLGASLGFSRWVSLGGGGSRLFFTAALEGGLKFDLHKHVHLRLVARLPVTMAHGDLFCLSAAECVELEKFTPQVQGEAQFGVGVSF